MNVYEYQTAQNKGAAGEITVARILAGLNRSQYIVLNNVLLEKPYPTSNEIPTVQIDHLVVSVYGIFSIETKNYSGKIYGYEDAGVWKVYLANKEYKMQNPLRQNYAHTKTLQKILLSNAQALEIQNADFMIYPIVAFSGNADLSKVKVSGADVVHFSQIPNAILNKSISPVLTARQMDNIARFIASRNIISAENMQKHISSIRQYNGIEYDYPMPIQEKSYERIELQQFYSENASQKYQSSSSKVWMIPVFILAGIAITIILFMGGCGLLFYGTNKSLNNIANPQNQQPSQQTTVPHATIVPQNTTGGSGNTNLQPNEVNTKPLSPTKDITKVDNKEVYSTKQNATDEIAHINHGSLVGDNPFADKDSVQYDEYINMYYHDAFWDGIYIDINAEHYNKLSFSFTNGSIFFDSTVAKIQVSDTDTNELFYESEQVDMYHTKTAEVDITGHDNIRLSFIDEGGDYYYIVLKDIILSDPVN